MPMIPFRDLPDSARVWIFASDAPLEGAVADTLLSAVDEFLSEWKAHGVPLRCARDWRDDRFLAIGVDITQEAASGCSIDGLFRTLRELESAIGSRLLGGGRVFYRARTGVETVPRSELSERIADGTISRDTPVLDTGLTEAGDWRERFERPAAESWVAGFFREV